MMKALILDLTKRLDDTKKKLDFYERDKDEDGVPKFIPPYPVVPKTIYINNIERRNHKCHWYFYKLLRALYVPWFYFMPSCFFFGQYLAPFLLNWQTSLYLERKKKLSKIKQKIWKKKLCLDKINQVNELGN